VSNLLLGIAKQKKKEKKFQIMSEGFELFAMREKKTSMALIQELYFAC
jgi:hypothetical protein